MHEYAHTYIHIGTYTVHTYIHISLLVHLEWKILISSQTITKSINPFSSTEIALHGIMQYTYHVVSAEQYTTWLMLTMYHVVSVEQYTKWLVLSNIPVA